MSLPPFLARWLGRSPASDRIREIEAQIDAGLAARKALRAQRQAASRKGWQTRRLQASKG